MSDSFEATLAKIKSYELTTFIEKAIETGVILPLLNKVGWNTDDPTEVKPEHSTDAGAVDWALRIGDVNRIFVEAKAGSVDLKACEDQLEKYCRAAKPDLAVLTNGTHWWLYLPPTRRKDAKIRRFLEFDINDEPREVADKFQRFLDRDKMATEQSVKSTVKAARALFDERENYRAVMRQLTEAWNGLLTDDQALADVVSKLAENHGILATTDHIERFLHSKNPLVNEATDKLKKPTKPTSFTFRTGSVVEHEEVETWADVLVGISKRMSKRHPDDFKRVLEIKGPFKKPFEESSETFKKWKQIGNTGIYVNLTAKSSTVKTVCNHMLYMFKYPANALTIEEL